MAASARGIYAGAAVSLALLAAAMILPRWFAGAGGGLEDSTAAALSFVACATGGVLLALSLIVRTVFRFTALPWPARLAGFAPSIAAGAIVAYVWRAL